MKRSSQKQSGNAQPKARSSERPSTLYDSSELFDQMNLPSNDPNPEHVTPAMVDRDTQAILGHLHLLLRRVRYQVRSQVHGWSSRWKRSGKEDLQLYLTFNAEPGNSARIREEPDNSPMMPD